MQSEHAQYQSIFSYFGLHCPTFPMHPHHQHHQFFCQRPEIKKTVVKYVISFCQGFKNT